MVNSDHERFLMRFFPDVLARETGVRNAQRTNDSRPLNAPRVDTYTSIEPFRYDLSSMATYRTYGDRGVAPNRDPFVQATAPATGMYLQQGMHGYAVSLR